LQAAHDECAPFCIAVTSSQPPPSANQINAGDELLREIHPSVIELNRVSIAVAADDRCSAAREQQRGRK
jgi:hypothetical protein